MPKEESINTKKNEIENRNKNFIYKEFRAILTNLQDFSITNKIIKSNRLLNY
jgi:hypothetical protein